MAKLSSYTKDTAITDKDKLAGSSFVGLVNGIPKYQTASYTIEDLGAYFSENITIGGQVYDIETIYNDLERTKTYTLGLQESFWSANEDGSLNTLSVAFANQVFSVTTSSKFATSLYVTNLGTSFGEFDVDGNLVSLAEAFANQVFTTTTSSKFATSIYVNNLGSSVGTLNTDGSLASLSEAFANSVITTTTSDKFAESTRVNTLGATLGVYDVNGNTLIASNAAFLDSVTVYVDGNSATASKVEELNSTLNLLDENGNAIYTNAQYLSNITTYVDDNSATASKVDQLNSTLNILDVNGNATVTNAEYLESITTYVDTNSASAAIARGLNTELGITDADGIIIKTKAQFDEEVSQYVDANSATASKVTNLNSTLDLLDVNGNAIYTNAQYLDNITTYVDTNAASAKIARGINTEFGITDADGVTIKTKAQFDEEITSYVDANSATANIATKLNSQLGFVDENGALVKTIAEFNEEITTYVDENSATAALAENLKVTVNGDPNIPGSGLVAELNETSSVVASKPNVYRQNEPPTGTIPVKSVWYDTNDNNKPYIYDGDPAAWVEARDGKVVELESYARAQKTIEADANGVITGITIKSENSGDPETAISDITFKTSTFNIVDQSNVSKLSLDANGDLTIIGGGTFTGSLKVGTSVVSAADIIDGAAAGASAAQPGDDISGFNNDAQFQDPTQVNEADKTAGTVGGWTIDNYYIYSGTEAQTTNDYDLNGITLANTVNGGAIRSANFRIDTDGSAFFKGSITGSAGIFGDVTINSNGITATNFSIDASGNVSVAGDITGSTGTFTGKLFAALGANSVINPDAYVAFGNVEVSNIGATITKNFPVLELSDDFRAIQARRAIYINTVVDDSQEFTGIRFFGTQLDANGDEDLLNKGMSIKADELRFQFVNDPDAYVPTKIKWRDAQKVVGGPTYKTEIYAEYNSSDRPYIVIDGDVRFQGDVDLGTGQIVGHPVINAGISTSNAAGTSTVIKNIDLDGNGHVLDTESISLTLDNITAAGNSTSNNIFVNNVIADAVIFDTANPETALPVGGLTWNPDESTLDLKLNESVTLQVGQEEVLRVVNKTGATLNEADFRAVRIRSVAEGGAQGQRLAVLLAQGNNDANSATTIGLVTETILNNAEGFITLSGKVNGINTTGAKSYLGLETWADGDILYLSPTQPGYLTNVKPQAPQHTIIVGWVVYAHAIQGKIFVKVDNGYEIDELHNVRVNGVTAGDLLVYNDVDAVWENKKSIAGLTMTGSLVGPTNFIIDPAVEGLDSGTVEIKGAIDVNGDANFDGNVVIDGNLTVSGTTITIEATNLSVADNMIYLNAGSTVSNPDLGFAGNYNDGTYAHAGLFRDATDGRWKFFQGYTLEPDASSFIDTAHASFALAPLEVTTLYGNVIGNVTGNVTGNLTGNVTGNITGNAATATDADKLDGKHASEFTLAYVTSNNNSTTNNISVGNITSGSINASGAINGKIILNKTYASVSGTAQPVVGLNAVTSGLPENALFELTVFGEGWYHKAVITCYHNGTLGGDWSAYLSINEGDGVVIFSTSQTSGVLTINVLSTDALATPAVYVHVEYLGELNNLIQNPV